MDNAIWQFRTKNFLVTFTAEPEFSPDFSWDETGETQAKVASGEWQSFCAKVAVHFRGCEIGADYLGDCVYETPETFINHRGLARKSREDGRNYGSYFSDMVKEAIREARQHFSQLPKIRG